MFKKEKLLLISILGIISFALIFLLFKHANNEKLVSEVTTMLSGVISAVTTILTQKVTHAYLKKDQ